MNVSKHSAPHGEAPAATRQAQATGSGDGGEGAEAVAENGISGITEGPLELHQQAEAGAGGAAEQA